MASQFHSLFTTQGLALLREAIQNGTKIGITHMAYGDGNGIVPTPNADFTKLVKEVYRTPLNRLSPSKENSNWLEADGVIPSAVGGFNIREVGLYAGNVLVAYANYPATYKPSSDQGTAQIKTIRIVLQIDNTANFELKIDASVVMATREYVDEQTTEVGKNIENIKIESENLIYKKTNGKINLLEFIPEDIHSKLLTITESGSVGAVDTYIQQCFDYAEVNRYDVEVPFGYYFISQTIMLPRDVHVTGLGMPYFLTTTPFNSKIMVSCDKSKQDQYFFSRFNLNGNGKYDLEGLRIGGCRNSIFSNIKITSCPDAGIKLYPTHPDSGDIENFELNHIWTVLSAGIKLITNSTINRGNITDGEIYDCQLTTGDENKNTGLPVYWECSPDRYIFGVRMQRIFTMCTENNHIAIKPNGGQIFSNTFSDFSGESWKI